MKYGKFIGDCAPRLPIPEEDKEKLDAFVREAFKNKATNITFKKNDDDVSDYFSETLYWYVNVPEEDIPFTDRRGSGVKIGVKKITAWLSLQQGKLDGEPMEQYSFSIWTDGYCHYPRCHHRREKDSVSHTDWPSVYDYDTDIEAFRQTLEAFVKKVWK